MLQRLRPTPIMTGTLSSTHTASPRLLVASRPPSPSRPTPLELVGVLATSAAVACAKPPSAPCGGRSDALSPVLCALSAGVALLAVGLVLDTITLLRILGKSWRTWSILALPVQDVGFSGAVGAGRGEDALGSHVLEFENLFETVAEADSLETLRMRKAQQELSRSQEVVARGGVHHSGTCTTELRRSQQCELVLLSARLHEASFSCHFYTLLWSTDSLDVWMHPLIQSTKKNCLAKWLGAQRSE